MKTVKLMLMLCVVMTFTANAQKQLSKISKSVNVDKDVTIDLNTSYVQIEVDTWNKNIIEIEAYIESDKLSKEELQAALEKWDLEVEGSGDYVTIRSKGARGSWGEIAGISAYNLDYSDALKELELRLADMPEIPEMPALPEMPAFVIPNIADMPNMPELPEMPEFPELPELPEGVNSINFDYDQYKKNGEKYLDKWSKEYEKKGGKELQKKMKDWARKFGESNYQEKMEQWGERFGKRFEGKWAKEMEEWGERFAKEWDSENGAKISEEWAKKMEKWGEEYGKRFDEKWQKDMEAWSKSLDEELIKKYGKDYERELEKRQERLEERREALERRVEERERSLERRYEERAKRLEERLAEREAEMTKRKAEISRRIERGGESKAKKTIKIKMPKGAKLNLNVRHGELKFSAVHDLKADVSHSTLLANSIDGSETSINAAYSSILVDNWNDGTLSLNYVDDALLKNVESLMLNSNSSDINIDYLSGNTIIDGSFGELTVKELSKNFNNLNVVLENSDAFVKLPNTDYKLVFKGNRSRFNNESTNSKTINNYPSGNKGSGKTIMVNAKFSNVVMQ